MLKEDCEIIEGYFDYVCTRPLIRDAWERIKTALAVVQKPSHNSAIVPCPLWVYPAPTCNLGYDCICKSVPCQLLRAQHQ